MATDTAAPTLRHLWQMPAFLVGAAAFVAVWRGFIPVGAADHSAPFRHDLAALASACEKLTPDPAEIESLVRKVARGAEAFPELATPAHFALGSAYVRLAEITPAADVARSHWNLGAQHFERVRADQFTDPMEAARLGFRSAKARAAVGAPPSEVPVLIPLVSAVPPGDEPGEAHRLAAELWLRLPQPDFKHARDSLGLYVAQVGLSTPPASVARAKLRLSEVHLRLNEPDAARKWLDQLGPDAPPDVFVPGKAQRARILMSEAKWADAAKDWEQVRSAALLPPGLKPSSAYYLGVCRLALRDPDAAAKLFEESAKADGPEAGASSVRLAEIGLRSPDPARHKTAAQQLASAVSGAKAGAFANPLVPANEVQAAFEAAVQVLLADGAFDDAEKTAVAYKAVATAGRDREKRAEVLAAWGDALQKSGGPAKPKFTAAAEEYVALADAQPAASAKADLLRRAAEFHKQAGNTTATVDALEAAVRLPNLPDEAAGPAWLDYGEALMAAGRTDEVVKALNKAMSTKSGAAIATRYRLARACLDSRHVELVKLGTDLLKQIADASEVAAADHAAQERALVELAHDYVQARNYGEAEARLRKQLNFYPTGPESGFGRLLLGVCLLQRSARPTPASPDAPDAPKLRDEALALFRQVITDTDAKAKPGVKLPERDEWLRVQASIRVLQTYDQMRKPHDVLSAAGELLPRTTGTVEELIVLSMMYHANKQLNKVENALRVRDQMKAVFDALPPSAFTKPSGDYSRAFWEQKWFAADPPPMKE